VTGRLLTARQVAELVGVSPETVLRWTRRGELPAIRLPGGRLRYDAAAIDEWLVARATSRNPGHAPNPARNTASPWGKGVTVEGSVGDGPSRPESVT
jgi:excisionase family DNA binding protein